MDAALDEPVVLVRGLRKAYGSVTALNGVDLAIGRGEIFGLLGRNGAGKSTALDIICGLLAPSAGQVEVFGRDVRGHGRSVRRRIGYVPQDNTVYLAMTVWQNLRFAAIARGLSRRGAQRRAAEVMERLGLDRIADRGGAYLSGGERRRLSIGMGIVHSPPLMVLDEPSTGVDIDSRHAIHNLLRELRGEGSTILYTTHHLEEAESLCDRVGVLDTGSIVVTADVKNFVAEYASPYCEIATDETAAVAALLRDAVPDIAITVRDRRIRVSTPQVEILPAVVRAIDESHLPVKDVRSIPVSLENAFLHALEQYRPGSEVR
ncbi:ABC transporter ATP-binding protein [Nocardia pseudobrasiliensis]|uniref:ABC-2 type transport system ATP-binding protein n=1 Tax=Nocardia pseudobrasiliensis TaxID=45979 RepID=A0A370I464_9NOCA|nr:ABC transporter ATP-binding protein [Nocardia pseudobrasiliensis]RDI65533.1 ABC-2 type transport system ATP-binding protein [Nocardia pseudobrasiliensis]